MEHGRIMLTLWFVKNKKPSTENGWFFLLTEITETTSDD